MNKAMLRCRSKRRGLQLGGGGEGEGKEEGRQRGMEREDCKEGN